MVRLFVCDVKGYGMTFVIFAESFEEALHEAQRDAEQLLKRNVEVECRELGEWR